MVGFLNNCDAVLTDTGFISLVIPDKRFCFDHYRPITGISKIIDSHFQKNSIHTPGTVAEYFLNVVRKAGELGWNPSTAGPYNLIHALEQAQQGIQAVINDKAYLDVHAWCFVPHSFRLIIHDLYSLGLIPFQEVEFFPNEDGFEFYITLSRNGKGPNKSRMEMLNAIETELLEGAIESEIPAETTTKKNIFRLFADIFQ